MRAHAADRIGRQIGCARQRNGSHPFIGIIRQVVAMHQQERLTTQQTNGQANQGAKHQLLPGEQQPGSPGAGHVDTGEAGQNQDQR